MLAEIIAAVDRLKVLDANIKAVSIELMTSTQERDRAESRIQRLGSQLEAMQVQLDEAIAGLKRLL